MITRITKHPIKQGFYQHINNIFTEFKGVL